jgi:hypothetical protein
MVIIAMVRPASGGGERHEESARLSVLGASFAKCYAKWYVKQLNT